MARNMYTIHSITSPPTQSEPASSLVNHIAINKTKGLRASKSWLNKPSKWYPIHPRTETVPLFANTVVRAWLTKKKKRNISKQRLHCNKGAKWLPHLRQLNQTDPEHNASNKTKGWKRGFLLLMMKTPKETSVLTASQKPTAIWDIKWRTFHNWLYKTSKQHVRKKKKISTQSTL